MTTLMEVYPDTYVDSVVQLRGIRAMREVDGVQWASAAMATPANVEELRGAGIDVGEVAGAGAGDFFLVVRATSEEAARKAIAAGRTVAMSSDPADRPTGAGERPAAPRSLRAALAADPGANVAVISLPGDYAALAAYQSLSAGLHVLLFSDNVPLETEVAIGCVLYSFVQVFARRGR